MLRGRDPHQKYPLLPPPLKRFDEEDDVDHSDNFESESPQSEDSLPPAPWNELPNECRGVHPRWKSGMDSLLEQACLEGWTKWKPWCSSSPFLNSGVTYGFPILKAAASSKGFNLNSSLFPSSILDKTHQGNPFPTKSTFLKFITSHRFHYERNVLMKVEEFFSNWGNHLTSLTLWSFTTQAKIRPKGLQIILQNTPNLKALTLNGMSIDLTRSKSLFENEEARLPPLSKLEHVLITDVYSEGNDPVAEEHNLCNWVLDPYKQQLVGLETDSHFGGGGHESPLNYANLKQLKMWMPKAVVMKAPLSCPQLERLSLRELSLLLVFRRGQYPLEMASSAREQLFRKRTPSKYEEKGKDFRTYLNEMLRDKDYRFFYEYQMRAVMSTERFLLIDEAETQSVKRVESEAVLIVAPTGSGKSGMIMLLPRRRVFFQVTGFCKKENSDECDDEGLENLLETGMIITDANQIHSRLPNLVIVNAQKFGGKSRLSLEYDNREIVDDVGSFFSQFDTLIVDEAHHYPAKTWLKIVQEFKKPAPGMQKQIIFITATPYRSIRKTIRRQEFTDSGKRSELVWISSDFWNRIESWSQE
ncbi:hypothetical protein Ocin01_18126 [Orchesella cincta]|uniref:Helicase ATP-binding domain-containing protein n=1 Tax=Orchesella cincta TaxID=48709 RepID=A0A1D2M6G9_ORCCI|nr:hypothetical protein Ocin01_18126 [Orchesella cincta]